MLPYIFKELRKNVLELSPVPFVMLRISNRRWYLYSLSRIRYVLGGTTYHRQTQTITNFHNILFGVKKCVHMNFSLIIDIKEFSPVIYKCLCKFLRVWPLQWFFCTSPLFWVKLQPQIKLSCLIKFICYSLLVDFMMLCEVMS